MESELIAKSFRFLFGDETKKTVTAFLPPLSNVKERIRVTRCKKDMGFRVEIGKPNYREREFLKKCKRAKCRPGRFLFHFSKS